MFVLTRVLGVRLCFTDIRNLVLCVWVVITLQFKGRRKPAYLNHVEANGFECIAACFFPWLWPTFILISINYISIKSWRMESFRISV